MSTYSLVTDEQERELHCSKYVRVIRCGVDCLHKSCLMLTTFAGVFFLDGFTELRYGGSFSCF